MRNISAYLTANTNYSAGTVFVLALLACFGLPTGWLCALLIGFVTLAKSVKSGTIVLAWAVLPAIALTYTGNYIVFINLILLHCVIVWLLAITLRRSNSWAITIQAITIVGIVSVIALHLSFADISNWWSVQLKIYLQHLNDNLTLGLSKAQINDLLTHVYKIFTGLLIASISLLNLLILLLARWWQTYLLKPGILAEELTNVRMNYLAAALLLLCVVGIVAKSALAFDIIPIILLPFVLSGLSLLHSLTGDNKQSTLFLIGIYCLLVFFLYYMALLLAGLGLIDSCLNFRQWKFLLKKV